MQMIHRYLNRYLIKIPVNVAVTGYPDLWHPDPPDVDMTLATLNIHGCSIYFSLCIIPQWWWCENRPPRVFEVGGFRILASDLQSEATLVHG